MNAPEDPVRRAMMIAIAGLSAIGAPAKAGAADDVKRSGARSLVAYFSRSGNTRVIAGQIHRALGTDLFEIRPASAYPDDYLATVEQARQERDRGFEPALESAVATMAGYDTVYLGFPIWARPRRR